jgi:hypothetical protein
LFNALSSDCIFIVPVLYRSEPRTLYPPISINSPVEPCDDDIFLIEKSRDITFRFLNSPFHITKKTEEKDIVRYSDRNKSTKLNTNTNMLQYVSEYNVNIHKYMPQELLVHRPGAHAATGSTRPLGDNNPNSVDVNLGRLMQRETAETMKKNNEKGEDGSDIDAADGEELDESELDDDYGVDHYASDGGGESGDDEPTF